jgi:hypothetical protein
MQPNETLPLDFSVPGGNGDGVLVKDPVDESYGGVSSVYSDLDDLRSGPGVWTSSVDDASIHFGRQ